MMPHRHAAAFTLVELLVVIGIVVILMGMLIPAVGYIQTRGAIATTTSTLNQVEGAITVFKTNAGHYPGEGSIVPRDGSDPVPDRDYRPEEHRELIANALARALGTIDEDSFGANGGLVIQADPDDEDSWQIVDAWEEAVYYQPFTTYLDVDDVMNPSSYQIWSYGPDNLNDVGDVAQAPEDEEDVLPWGDDVYNWSN